VHLVRELARIADVGTLGSTDRPEEDGARQDRGTTTFLGPESAEILGTPMRGAATVGGGAH
jgi:hypothetical protein